MNLESQIATLFVDVGDTIGDRPIVHHETWREIMDRIWLKHYPKDVAHSIDIENYASIVDVFIESCRTFGDRPAFSNMGVTITFHELDVLSNAFASYLQNHTDLKVGDRIALQMPNCLQFPVALLGSLKAGLIVVNTNPLYTAREMKHQFCDSGAKGILILANFAHHLQEILAETQIQTVLVTELGDMFGFPKKHIVNAVLKHVKKMVPSYSLPRAVSFSEVIQKGKLRPPARPQVRARDVAFLQYTGGTTGVAKGAVLTHRNILSNMEQIVQWMKPKLRPGQEIVITALPLYHIFSLTVNCMAFFKYGGHNILITNPRDIPGFIKELRKVKFTVITGVNTLFNALMNHPDFKTLDFSTLKVSVAGAMALQKAVATRWMEMTQSLLVEGYGLTESSPVACCNPIDGTDRVGTIGIPLPDTDVKLIDDSGNEVLKGEAGEICIRGPQVMLGYYNRAEETQNVLSPDGWLKTGDIAQMDNEGYFKIVDRKKDMILVSGFNVYPNEVEDVLAQHPGVLEVAAIGVPDARTGEAVKVVLVKREGHDPSAEQLIEFCRKNLTAYKVPKHVEFRKELPKTNVGKILRRALRENTIAQIEQEAP